jgi:hypothetical protein
VAPDAAGRKSDGVGHDSAPGLAELAAAMANLSPADRAKLAAMLAGDQGEGRS